LRKKGRFRAAVREGIAQADRGEFIEERRNERAF
jgi:predicted transcriptional regulator